MRTRYVEAALPCSGGNLPSQTQAFRVRSVCAEFGGAAAGETSHLFMWVLNGDGRQVGAFTTPLFTADGVKGIFTLALGLTDTASKAGTQWMISGPLPDLWIWPGWTVFCACSNSVSPLAFETQIIAAVDLEV